MYSSKARLVFCWAHKLGFLNETVERVWFIPGFYSMNWWNYNDTHCTPAELKSAINHVILTDTINLRTDGKRAISGVTTTQYMENLHRWPTINKYKSNSYHPYGYDTAWAVALSLNATLNELQANPAKYDNKLLEDFTYNNSKMSELIKKEMFALYFEGITGTVKFTATGDRTGTLTVLQRVDNTRNFVGIYDGIKDKLNYTGGSANFHWNRRKVPTDGSQIINIIIPLEVNFTAALIIATLSLLGVPFSLTILGINNKYRNIRSIKVSSPTVNIFICVGAIFMYLANISYSLYQAVKYQVTDPIIPVVLCEIWKWFLPIGFTLSMGAIFSKAFRIYVIYASVQGKPRRRKISDRSLMKLIGIFLLIDAIILSLWSIIDPLRMITTVVESKPSVDNPDVTHVKQIYYCSSSYLAYWMLVLGTKETILLLFGMIVAYGTRNVPYKDLNDARLTITIVYNFAVVVVITGPLRFALDSIIPTPYFIIDGSIIWISITVMMSIIFLPKFCRMQKVKDTTIDLTNGTNKSQSKEVDYSHGNSHGNAINPKPKEAPVIHLAVADVSN
ncbi:uncharacterized protein TRIADDRAFT_55428 [Trichoplax adhaerens]|uniref:G-protein coupled receptors family 3 profile domain-containing protein n=1 Tax=Trichoplax adhaerens TaxID=10228 RepID=B3RUV5_TRIAD|nr:hypothetical protein TRIADDRAFT_55428 [Trichoplax adhaerens]EDV25892.1 hypothetical protein TRIADDRAFT_55428 [Trichoplax adhaerens]|eukprot:XP_002111925.1 hypothetical protein TRIADDRAFT_55428 [Trichoplax adhaerens]